MSGKKTMTVDEAARELGISRNSAYTAVQRGEIPALRIGRRFLIPKQAIDKLCEDACRKAETKVIITFPKQRRLVRSLRVSERTRAALIDGGIEEIGECDAEEVHRLLCLPNIGRIAIGELMVALQEERE